jgi:hypothetical protein
LHAIGHLILPDASRNFRVTGLGQVLLIQAFEKNGGRSQILKIKNADLVKAQPLDNLKLKI